MSHHLAQLSPLALIIGVLAGFSPCAANLRKNFVLSQFAVMNKTVYHAQVAVAAGHVNARCCGDRHLGAGADLMAARLPALATPPIFAAQHL